MIIWLKDFIHFELKVYISQRIVRYYFFLKILLKIFNLLLLIYFMNTSPLITRNTFCRLWLVFWHFKGHHTYAICKSLLCLSNIRSNFLDKFIRKGRNHHYDEKNMIIKVKTTFFKSCKYCSNKLLEIDWLKKDLKIKF